MSAVELAGVEPPGGGVAFTVLGYVVWGIVAIAAIIFVFQLLACFGGLHLTVR